MRYTGLAIALIGAVVAVFTGIAALSFTAPSEADAVIHAQRRAAPDLFFPLVIACVAVVVGLAMYWYGGTGYDQRDVPAAPPGAVEG
jgi:hypothetical protein